MTLTKPSRDGTLETAGGVLPGRLEFVASRVITSSYCVSSRAVAAINQMCPWQ